MTTYNTHQVGERLTDAGCLLKTREVGLAIRPTVALLNHSCCPNTVRCSAGDQVVIVASATIHPGTEVADIYSQCYYEQDREARQVKCAEYRFTCQCPACEDNWPLADQLPGAIQDTPSSHLQPGVDRRMLPQLARELAALERQAKEHWNNENIEQSLEYWCQMCAMAEKIFKNPSKLLIVVRKSIQLCLWRLHGYSALTSSDKDDNSLRG